MLRLGYIMLLSILVLCISAEFSPEHKVEALAYVTECVKEWKVSFETVAQALYGEGPFPSADNFKEFLVCSSKKSGTLDANGKLNMDVAKQRLHMAVDDPKEADRIFGVCVKEYDTPQETAHHVYGCLHAEGVKI